MKRWWLLVGVLVSLFSWSARAKQTWSLVYSKPGQDNAIYSIWATDATHAWGLGVDSSGGNSTPLAVRTTNGSAWGDMSLPASGGGQFDLTMFLRVAFADENHGWLYGVKVSMTGEEALLYESTDGGSSWVEITAPSKGLEDLQALPGGLVYGVGDEIVFFGNNGQYSEVTAPVPAGMHLSHIFMLNPNCGAVLASSDDDSGQHTGALLWSSDGGQTWTVTNPDLGFVPGGAWFIDGSRGWVTGSKAGAGLVAWTQDGGQTWTEVSIPDHPPVMGNEPVPVTSCAGVRFFDETRGVAACLCCTANCDDQSEDNPSYLTAFVRSEDGGRTWTIDPDYEPQMTAPPFGDMVKYSGLFGLAFPDPNHGFLAGQNGLILRYEAAEPEAEGWSDFPCEAGSNSNNSNTNNGNTNNSSNNNGQGGDGGDAQLDGCGCRSGAPAGPAGLVFGLLALALVFRRRRR